MSKPIPVILSDREKEEFCQGYEYCRGTSTKAEKLPDSDSVWLRRSELLFDFLVFTNAKRAGNCSAWSKGYAVADYLLEMTE